MGGVTAAVLAIDGGNSKTDVCLVSAEGYYSGMRVGRAPTTRTSGSTPPSMCLPVWSAKQPPRLESTLALRSLSTPRSTWPAPISPGVEMLHQRASSTGWAAEVTLDNDTFALLRAGTSTANRIAVVCGAGINCVGVSAAGGDSSLSIGGCHLW